ncbi:MAG TPA: HAMP domain-containing sensor histidine kinase [Vicinamibacterales bacterium]|nr:HAMP domain-containing sensor histidine kinase [Vicinamibacterales bacterium]
MSLRTRLVLAFAAVVFIPLAVLAFGLRQEMTRLLSDDYEKRVNAVGRDIRNDLDFENARIDDRLASLKNALLNDNQFRAGAVGGLEPAQTYVLDYAGTAMHQTGLSMLQIHDADGRIVSSGHFRNEHGREGAGFVAALAAARNDVAFVTAHTPDGDFLALARLDRVSIANRSFILVGGIAVDDKFLTRLTRDRDITVSLDYPGGGLSSLPREGSSGGAAKAVTAPDVAVRELDGIRVIRWSAAGNVEILPATLRVTQSRTILTNLLHNTNAVLLTTAAVTGAAALLLAVWMASRISRPLTALTEKTAVLDLDRLDIRFDDGTDEVGVLSRVMSDLAERLRTSSARIREAERRATIGDLARQINHDIKNGLIPLRNVMRHLSQVERDDPGAVASVLAERRQTVDSSIMYLETLATNYERLSPQPNRRECDLNALISEVLHGGRGHEAVEVQLQLAPNLPRVVGDPVAFRRILENLTANAIDSLESKPGRIVVSTETVTREDEPPAVRVTVSDTGRGMSKEELGKIFNTFYTTKERGSGLGLSIVRRLVTDLQGTLRVESEPGVGTTMIIELPAGRRRG